MSASEMPGATLRRDAVPAVPRPRNASMIPQTVPNSPMKGVTAPVVASQVSQRSKRVSSDDVAICSARSTDSRLRIRGLPGFSLATAWPSISRVPARKTSGSGLDLSGRHHARMSESFLLWRKTLRNSREARRAALKLEDLWRIMAQEKIEKSKRMPRTIRATSPVFASSCQNSPWKSSNAAATNKPPRCVKALQRPSRAKVAQASGPVNHSAPASAPACHHSAPAPAVVTHFGTG